MGDTLKEMVNQPLLSIGIPAFNEGKFLQKTLKSILDQTFSNFVVYVCDGGSTDNTFEIAKNFASLDARIKLFHSKERISFVDNWKVSLTASTTKYFAWIGAHDLLHPDYFLEAIRILETNDRVSLVYPQSVEIDGEGVPFGPADSDIETQGLNANQAINKLSKNLHYCTAIHGIFRSHMLKKLPIKRIMGFDFLILLLTCLYGEIRKTETVTFYRRTVRVEDAKDAMARWRASGMFEPSKYAHFEILVKNCILNYFYHCDDNVIEKILTVYHMERILRRKFGLTRFKVMKCLLNL